MTAVWIGYFCRKGAERERLQDAVLIGSFVAGTPSKRPVMLEVDMEHFPLVAVLDGVGGHAGGQVASRSAGHHLAGLAADLHTPEDLPGLLVETCRRVTDEGMSVPALAGMGTTVAGLWFSAGEVSFFNVGDSRVYLERDGYLTQCTVDDVADQSESAPLSQCLGAGLRHIEPHLTTVAWPDRGLALLCTDGFDRRLSVSDIEAALRRPDPLQALWELADGADDDASVVLVDGRYAKRPERTPAVEPDVDRLFDPYSDPEPQPSREVSDVRPPPIPADPERGPEQRGLRSRAAGIRRRRG